MTSKSNIDLDNFANAIDKTLSNLKESQQYIDKLSKEDISIIDKRLKKLQKKAKKMKANLKK